MEQIQKFELQEQVSLDRSVGSLFADWLEQKNRVSEFDNYSKIVSVSVDGVFVRMSKGFPSKVSEIMKMVVRPNQEVRFHPAIAGG